MSTSKSEEFQEECYLSKENGESSCSSSETALITNSVPPQARNLANIENVPEDLVSRLLFVSDEEALQYGDENLGVLWKETFPTDTCPTDRYKIVEELRKVHPRGNLKKNDELFRVVNKKRKMEECFQNVQNLYTDNTNIHNSLVDEEDESWFLLPQNLKAGISATPLKKFKNEIIRETTKGVCDELVEHTRKNLKVEDILNNIKNEIEALKKQNGEEIEALKKQSDDVKNEIEDVKKQSNDIKNEIQGLKIQSNDIKNEIESLKRLFQTQDNRTTKLENDVRVLKKQSNDRLVEDIYQRMKTLALTMEIMTEESLEMAEIFHYNLNRLANERNLTPNDLKMFTKFKQYFPLQKIQPSIKEEMSSEEFVKQVSSLFKSLD